MSEPVASHRGRPVGSSGTCSHCGQRGHKSGIGGTTCSPVHVALLLVDDYGWTVRDAADHLGVPTQSVYTLRRHRIRKQVRP